MTRREQVREAIARHRKRRKRGFLWRPIVVTKAQLDQLVERGYLNPAISVGSSSGARDCQLPRATISSQAEHELP
jgi:hypothetical protein